MARKGSGPGSRIHAKGYVQITRRGPWYGWLEHRKVMLEACRRGCYYDVSAGLPEGFTVEHLDHNRRHNCLGNLLLLDKRIHDHLSYWTWLASGRNGNGHGNGGPRSGAGPDAAGDGGEPDWVTSESWGQVDGQADTQANGQVDGQPDGQPDGQLDVHTDSQPEVL